MIFKKLILLFVAFVYSVHVFSYFLSTGTHVPYFDKAQVANSGATQKFALNPYVGAGLQYNLSASQFFTPEVGYVYYFDEDDKVRTELLSFQYNFSYVLTPQFLLRYGLSNNWLRIIGAGGTLSLDNGRETKTFLVPDKTVTTYYTTLNLGTEYMLPNRKYSIRFDLNTMSLLKFDKRIYNYLLTFNFYR